jgi:homocysteine S-methyltransferase
METIRRTELPQLKGDLFLTDGGLETTLIFHRGLDLPEFAAFDLLKDEEGIEELRRYYVSYLELAKDHDAGFVLESPTWRASPRWAEAIGYSADELDEANRRAIALMAELRDRYESDVSPIVISGNIGPQDDGYDPKQKLSADQAADYHSTQIATFADTEADMVTALTMTYVDEAIGVTRAARQAGLPVAISFTLETDGRLPSGRLLG